MMSPVAISGHSSLAEESFVRTWSAAVVRIVVVAACLGWAFWLSSEYLVHGRYSYYREHDTAEANGAFYVGQAQYASRGLLGYWTPSAGSGVDALSNNKGVQPLFEGLFRLAPRWWTHGVILCFEVFAAAFFTVVLLRRRLAVPVVPALLAGYSFSLIYVANAAYSGVFLPSGLIVPCFPLVLMALTWAGEQTRTVAVLSAAAVGVLLALTSQAALTAIALLLAGFWIVAVEPRRTWRHAVVLGTCVAAFAAMVLPAFAAMSMNAVESHRTLWPVSFSIAGEAARWAARRDEVKELLRVNAPFLIPAVVGWLFGGWSDRSLSALLAVSLVIVLEIQLMIPIRNLLQILVPSLATFQVDRVSWFLPFLAAAAGAAGLHRIWHFFAERRHRATRALGVVMVGAACVVIFAVLLDRSAEVNRLREVLRRNTSNYASFFEQPELRVLAQEVRGGPLVRVATFAEGNERPGGQHAGFAWAYGFETADGYLNLYSIRYHTFWMAVIRPALELRDDLQEYFQDWGSMFYLFNPFGSEQNPKPAAHAFNLNLLSLANVRYLISAVALEDPRLVEWAGNRGRPGRNPVQVAGHGDAKVNQVFVYENRSWLPRFFVATASRTFDTREALIEALGDADLDTLRNTAFLEARDGDNAMPPAAVDATGEPRTSTVRVSEYSADRIGLDVDSAAAGTLVATNAYSRFWRAWVNGRPARVLPVDCAFQGIAVPAGRSHVRLVYDPPYAFPMWQRSVAVGALVATVLGAARIRRRRERPLRSASDVRKRRRLWSGVALAAVGVVAIWVGLAVAMRLRPVATAWADPQWPYRQRLQIQNSEGMLSPTDLPILVQRDAEDTAFWSHVSSASGLRFTDASGRTLPYEIETFDLAGHAMVAWVRVPAAGREERSIYLYYGNPAAADAQDSIKLWDRHYVAVWHFNDPLGSTTIRDSTAHAHQAVIAPEMRRRWKTAGRIGDGVLLTGSTDKLIVPDSSDWVFGPEDWSLEVWMKPTAPNKRNFGIFERGSKGLFQLWLYSGGYLALERRQGSLVSEYSFANAYPPADAWTHVMLERSQDRLKLSIDGQVNEGGIGPANFADSTEPADLILGWGSHGGFDGVLDEMRISKGVRRPVGWSRAVYLAQTGGLVEADPEERRPEGVR